MRCICEKEKLINALTLVGKTVSTRTTLPILECVLINAENGQVKLTANDLEMCVETAPFEAEVPEDGSLAVEAKIFNDIVRKMPGDVVEIKTDKNNFVTFESGRARLNKIPGINGEEFPSLPDFEKNAGCTLKAKVLREMIKQTIFSVANDETKPILTGELLEQKDGMLHVVAIDGHRISYRRQELEGEDMKIVVPAKSLNELCRILPAGDEDVTFYFTDKRILFELPGFTFVSRLLEGDFLRYEQIFSEDFSTIVTVSRMDLLMSIDRACLIAREVKKEPVKFSIGDFIEITSRSASGETYDELLADIDGKPLEISFNPKYLTEALRAVDDEKVTLKFTTKFNPCIIKGYENDAYKYLILPLRTMD
ncbi:MAG: DNA polymerase III subunit beta [Defluviitaleaceae bacterium]|nr:DNA polymerase III subunit beta [Defluviitaleaceae bacterium]